MKSFHNILFFVVTTLLFIACSNTQNQQPTSTKAPENKEETEPKKADFITGTVAELMPGKDGYTARINTATGEIFLVTISRANLTDPTTYRSVKVGEIIKVKGDHWEMENEKHITVQEFK